MNKFQQQVEWLLERDLIVRDSKNPEQFIYKA